MRLVRDDPTEFDVEWRFCHPGAKLLGIPTVFDSRVWESEQRGPSGFENIGLGEVTEGRCPRKIVRGLCRGKPRGPSGRGAIHGDPSWWANGLPDRSLFSLERPALICGVLPWMGKGVALGPKCDETVFASYSLLQGAKVKLGGEGVFVAMLTCCWPIHGLAPVKLGGEAIWSSSGSLEGGAVQLGGSGLFIFSDPESFQGTGGVELGGEGVFEDTTPDTSGFELGGEGVFEAPVTIWMGGPEIGGEGIYGETGLEGAGGIMPRVSAIFGVPPLAGDGNLLLGGVGSFLSSSSELEGSGGLMLGGEEGAVITLGDGALMMDGEGAFGPLDFTGEDGPALAGEALFEFTP